MKKSIKPKNSEQEKCFNDINTCPICNHAISPKYLCSYLHMNDSKLSVYCECPSCGKPFIALFSHSFLDNNSHYFGTQDYLAPTTPKLISFDKSIENLSNSFVQIFNEANSAETYHLNNISGIGYRKALEFLIKDYCVYKYPDKEKTIKSSFLSKVITDYIDSSKIRNLAKASTWLGNDETHYVRKFEDKDINDLKKFISATVAFITYDLVSDEAESLISSK